MFSFTDYLLGTKHSKTYDIYQPPRGIRLRDYKLESSHQEEAGVPVIWTLLVDYNNL